MDQSPCSKFIDGVLLSNETESRCTAPALLTLLDQQCVSREVIKCSVDKALFTEGSSVSAGKYSLPSHKYQETLHHIVSGLCILSIQIKLLLAVLKDLKTSRNFHTFKIFTSRRKGSIYFHFRNLNRFADDPQIFSAFFFLGSANPPLFVIY